MRKPLFSLLTLIVAWCGLVAAGQTAPVQVHTEAELAACASHGGQYCRVVADPMLNVRGIIHAAHDTTIDCNRRAIFVPAITGVQITNALGVEIKNCHFSTGSTDLKCLQPARDADLLGCPVDISARGASSYHIHHNTFAGPGLGKFIISWRFPSDAAEPSGEIDHNRFRDNWYGILAGASPAFTKAQIDAAPVGHIDFHNNYSLRVFKRTLRIAAYTAKAWNNLVALWGGDRCDASQLPPHGYGWAFSALGGSTLNLEANLFIPGAPPACQDPLDDQSTTLDKAPNAWGPGVIISRGNAGVDLPGMVSTSGGAVRVTRLTAASPVTAPLTTDQIQADIDANAGVQ